MQIAEYYTIRRAVQDNAPAPDADAATGMETELRAALLATGLFHTIEVGRTDDADRFVIAMCRFAPEVDAADVAEALAAVWTKQVAYGFWSAENLRVDKGHVELQGATRSSLRGHYLTVHVVAQEAPARLVVRVPTAVRQTPSTGIVAQPIPAARARRGWFAARGNRPVVA